MPQSPNVLLLMTDQQRFDTIHALGNPVIRTPSLDRLVREGTAFTSAYTPSPVCVPARCSLYWGQSPQRTGCYDNGFRNPVETPNLFSTMTDAGFRTHGIGKCHFSPGRDELNGFQSRDKQEELVGDRKGDDYLCYLESQDLAHIQDPHGVRGEMYYHPQPAQMAAKHHGTHWVGDRAIDFISQQPSDQPWFCMTSFIHPHPPFCPPTPWHKLYRAPLMPLAKTPDDSESLHTWVNRHQNRYKYRDQGVDLNLMRSLKAYYYACISFIDYQVGRIVESLEATGQLDNTLILYTSDHGEHLGDYHCVGKRSPHDTCARVPMLARLPERFEAGARCDRPATLEDIAATALAATNVAPKATLDGVDLAALARGEVDRDGVAIQYARGQRAIYGWVTDRWKYAYSAGDDAELLFDRVNDPDELRNRAGLGLVESDRKAMKDQLINHLKQFDDQEGLEGDDWRKFPPVQQSGTPDAGLLVQDAPWADTAIPGYTD